MLLRPFTIEDLPSVLEIEYASFAHPYDEEVFLHLWERDPGGFLVGCEEDRIVSYVIFSVEDGEGVVYSIAVHPSNRGRGFGRLPAPSVSGVVEEG